MTLNENVAATTAPVFDCTSVLNTHSASSPNSLVTANSAAHQAHLTEDGSRYSTYNFEVEGTHTYIAGDIRVHNTSLLDTIPKGATNIRYWDSNENGLQEAHYDTADGGRVISIGTKLDAEGNTTELERKIIYKDDGIEIDATVTVDPDTGETTVVIDDFKDKGAQYGAEVGKTLGSQFGTLIAGDNAFAKIGYSTVLGTLGENFGQFLQSSIKWVDKDATVTTIGALEEILTKYTLNNFGNELILNFKGQVTGHFSSLLMGEMVEAIGLEGFGAGAFTTVGNTITEQLLDNLSDVDAWAGGMQVDEIFAGFSPELFANAAGSFIGRSLANEVVEIDSIGESVFASIGSAAATAWSTSTAIVNAVSSAVAGVTTTAVSTFLTALILPGIGAFIGTVGGSVIFETVDRWFGGALSDQFDKWFGDHPAYYREQRFDDENNEITSQTGFNKDSNRDIESVVNGMEEAYKDTMHAVIDDIGGDADWATSWTYHTFGYHHSDNPEGWDDFKTELFRNTDGQRVLIHGKDTAGMVRAAIFQNLQNLEFKDGDLIKVAAHENWKDDVTQLGDGAGSRIIYTSVDPRTTEGVAEYMRQAQIANDYRKYLDNKDAIDALIANEPDSAFASGWVATLLAAAELGLGKSHNLTGTDKDNVFIAGENHDIIDGAGGNDRIEGYQGDDTLIGGSGDDVLNGGQGDDTLKGGQDNDTYVFNRGDGKDTIIDSHGTDELTFGAEISLEDLLFKVEGNDLRIYLGTDGEFPSDLTLINDVITVKDWVNLASRFEIIRFADGTALRNLTVTEGGSITGDAIIRGTDGDDTLNANAGDGEIQYAVGGAGNDTYVITRDTSSLWIVEDPDGTTGGQDTLRFVDIDEDELEIWTYKDADQGLFTEISWGARNEGKWVRFASSSPTLEFLSFGNSEAAERKQLDPGTVVSVAHHDLNGDGVTDEILSAEDGRLWTRLGDGQGSFGQTVGQGPGLGTNALITDGVNNAWKNGAYSEESFTGAGSLTSTVAQEDKYVMYGLSLLDRTAGTDAINYIMYQRNGLLRIVEDRVTKREFTDYNVGDQLKIERLADGTIQYLRNGELLYTSETKSDPATPLMADASFHLKGAILGDTYLQDGNNPASLVTWHTNSGKPVAGPEGPFSVAYEDLNGDGITDAILSNEDGHLWTRLGDGQGGFELASDQGRDFSTNALITDGVNNAWRNGAYSEESFTGAGALTSTVMQDDKYVMYGLSLLDRTAGTDAINFTMYQRNGLLRIVEDRVTKREYTDYNVGDQLKIERLADGTIQYLKNGELLYTSETKSDPETPLMADASFHLKGALLGDTFLQEGDGPASLVTWQTNSGKPVAGPDGPFSVAYDDLNGDDIVDALFRTDDGQVWTRLGDGQGGFETGLRQISYISGISPDTAASPARTFEGREGNDIFIFTKLEIGNVNITNFEAGASSDDVIRFDDEVFSDFDAILAAASDDGTDTIIALDDDNSVTLKGVLKSDLHQDDFQMV